MFVCPLCNVRSGSLSGFGKHAEEHVAGGEALGDISGQLRAVVNAVRRLSG